MTVERIFVKEGIKYAELEEFLAKKFEKAGYSHTEIQRTPLGTRLIVYAHKPGLVIVNFNQGKSRDRSHYEDFTNLFGEIRARNPEYLDKYPPDNNRILHNVEELNE